MSSELAKRAATEIVDYCSDMYAMPVTNGCDVKFATNRIQQAIDEEKLACASTMIDLADEIQRLKKENERLRGDYSRMKNKALRPRRRRR